MTQQVDIFRDALGVRVGEIEAAITEMRTTADAFIAERTTDAAEAAASAKAAHDSQHASATGEIASLLATSKEPFEAESE